jgi:hypothetical protein
MKGFSVSAATTRPLRAALAFVFLIMSSLQVGFFASASMVVGLHAMEKSVAASDSPVPHATSAGHEHHAADAPDHGDRDKSGALGDKSCEVHCAPVHGVPAGCPPLPEPAVGCHPEPTFAALRPGGFPEFIRPPRALI